LAGLVAEKRQHPSQYSLQLLGVPSIRRSDGSEIEGVLRQGKRFAVLVYLALQKAPVPRDLLIALFWPELDKLAAHRALRQTLYFLRHSVGPDAFVSLKTSAGVHSEYWSCDVTELERAFDKLDWETVVQRYEGEFLLGTHVFGVAPELEFWIEEKRQRLRERAHAALWKLAEFKRAIGKEHEAIELLRRALALGICDEVLLRELVILLHERGDRAGAIEVYERFAARLEADLEVEPAPETQSLIRSIRSESSKKQDEISSEEGVKYQELPTPLSPLVGRRREVDLVVHTLQREDVRLLSITGAGGMGKTRVALEAAALLARGFDGVCFVPLSPASGALHDQLIGSLRLTSLGADSQGFVLRHLAKRRVLLFLDNFESVLTEARSLSRLLSACPDVKALVTSICPLRIPHEFEQSLESLQIPTQTLGVGTEWPLNSEAAAYFLQCAEAVDREFRITEKNAESVLRICRAVDGIPLAIGLAAARLRELPVHELANRLEGGVVVLGEKHSTRPARHRTMTAAIDWTTQSLEQADRELFYALSVCEGAFSLHAAEHVLGRIGHREMFWTAIEALTERGLIKRPESLGPTEMLATVRVEARKAATRSGKADEYRMAFLRYYCAWLRIGHRNYCRDEEAEWLGDIEREHQSIHALLEWAIHRDPVRASRLVHGLWFYWWNRGLAAQGFSTITRLLKQRESLSLTAQGRLLVAAGNLALRGNPDEAIPRLREAVELFRRLDNPYRLGWALQSLGVALREEGTLSEAVKHLQEALEIGLKTRNVIRVAFCQQALGKLAHLAADPDGAESLLGKSLRSAQSRKDWSTAAYALCGLADIALSRGFADEAREYFERAKAHFETLGQKIDVAFTLERLARLAFLDGDDSQAAAYVREALLYYREVNYVPGLLKVLVVYGDQELRRGEVDRGIKILAGVHALANDHVVEHGLDARIQESLAGAKPRLAKREFDALSRIGRSLSLDELLHLARKGDSPVRLELVRRAVH
jgi:predicted ATPase/DNA-binding SARP family transcriptional activator